ncbi:alpha-hydroxy acid oxidase [Pusillimonas sp. NJUB218]|uniref:alpha-hydroxy acid oxidase n=1 Tax=Pusillimonas sp. NJUB218 TaxID=2023230 RepID=UPI000F4C7E37|nr:alpha-hydroxy acid oxidase [Pusillimonas sp. NJUB218]ROT46859.1 alpha-hydroxy-acid oxidizing enzyme [Pusillimonas sp. NJUB218]
MTSVSLLPTLATIPPTIASVTDYIDYARERVTPAAWAYLTAAAGDGLTAQDNIDALQRLKLLPNALQSSANASTAIELFGTVFPYPILLAPVAYQKLAHPDGELATVLGASAVRAGMVVSTQASVSLEDIAARAQTPLWFQLYMQPVFEDTLTLVRRAESAGYRAIVVTVDAPISGLRNEEQRAAFVLPPHIAAVNLPPTARAGTAQAVAGQALAGPLCTPTSTFDDLARLVAHTRLPVVAKGIAHGADARRAIDAGCAGIIVSNHGGRVLDTLPAAIDLLPGVVQAVGPQVPVLMDGGIRRGTDILKALALGARAVLIGRPQIYGLAAAGAAGVAHVLHILRTELEMAMLLSGRPRIDAIDASVLWA